MLTCRTRFVAVATVVSVFAGRYAQAQTSVFGTGSVALTYSDNVYNASSHPLPGRLQRRPAWFTTVAPGVGLTHETETARYLLTYSHSYTYYFETVDAGGHGDNLVAEGAFVLTPRDDLTLSVSGARTPSAVRDAEYTVPGQVEPEANVTYLNAGVRQTMRHSYSERWSAEESASVSVMKPEGGSGPRPWRLTAAAAVGAAYELEHDRWTFDYTATYFHSRASGTGDARVPRQRYLRSGPAAGWRHDLDAEWSTDLHVGLGVGYDPDQERRFRPEPEGGAALNWLHFPYSASINCSGATTPNLRANRLYFSDSVGLNGAWVVLPDQDLSLSTRHAASTNRTLGGTRSEDEPTVYAWTSSLALTWSPAELPSVSLSYEHSRQWGASSAVDVSTFHRNDVMLVAEWRFPTVEVRRVNSPPQTRVDRADELRSDQRNEPTDANRDASGSPARSESP